MNKRKLLLVAVFLMTSLVSGCSQEHTHTFGEWNIVKEATCKETGIEKRVCSCGKEDVNFINKIEHTEVIDQAKSATCVNTGLTEGVHCSVCNQVLVEQTVINTTNHIYDANVWQYISSDGHAHVCDDCGRLEIIPHISTGSATENKSELCRDCGYVITPATGHINHSASSSWTSNDEFHWHYCSGCDSKVYDVAAHNYGTYELEEAATATKEAKYKASCLDCGYITRLKGLKTPLIAKNGSYITWNAVDNAIGYKVYNGNDLLADVGNVTSYPINSSSLADAPLSVAAYTSSKEYFVDTSDKSNTLTFAKSDINLQLNYGTDFESYESKTSLFSQTGTLSTGWKADDLNRKVFGIQAGYQAVKLFKEGDNTSLKMYGGKELVRAGIDINDEIKNPGTYKATLDVKLGPDANYTDKILFKFHDKDKGITDGNKLSGSIYFWDSNSPQTLSKDNWVTLEVEFTIENTLASDYDLFIVLIIYTYNNKADYNSSSNYVLVDNLNFYKLSD